MTFDRRQPIATPFGAATQPHAIRAARPEIPAFQGFDPGGIANRVIRELNAGKWAVVFMRQSTLKQMRENLGSGEEQGDQARHLTKLGIDDPTPFVRHLDARGESGRAGAHRQKFGELEAMVRAGEVACVLVTREDRLGRNNEDSTRLLAAMAQHGVMLVVNGIPYDPSDVRQQFQLLLALGVAALDGGMRAELSMRSKRRRAEHLAFRIPLPAGLVWADPSDRAFLARAHEAGMADRIAAEALAAHLAKSPRERQVLYVLPYPDREVRTACELRIRWLFQFRSVGHVFAMIRRGADGWPHAGLVPVTGSSSYGRKSKVTWVRATRSGLRDWFRSPPVYGIYWYRSPWIAKRSDGGPGLPAEKRVEGAFVGFAPPEAYEEALAILRNPSARLRHGAKQYQGARTHALPVVRCAHPRDAAGTRCGYRLSAFYAKDKRGHSYASLHCRDAVLAHSSSTPADLDRVVVDLLVDTFRADTLRDAVTAIRSDTRATFTRHDDLGAEIRRLEGLSAEALRLQIEEGHEYRERRERGELPDGPDGPPPNPAETIKAQRMDYDRQLAALRPQFARAEQDQAALRAMTERDLERLYTLGADLRLLLARAAEVDAAVRDATARAIAGGDAARLEAVRAYEGRVRAVVEALVRTVWVHRVAESVYRVEVEFPTGARVARTFYTEYPRATDGERHFAYGLHRLAGRPAAEVSASLCALAHLRPGRPEWSPDRVRGAALSLELCGSPTAATAAHRDVATVAEEVGASSEDVLVALLDGVLDGVALGNDGTLRLAPSEAALHRAFPEHARRVVAAREEWPLEETVTVPELRRLRGVSWGVVENLSRRVRVVSDAARRRYLRRDGAALTDAERVEVALREAPESVRRLDRRYWVALRAVPDLLGRVTPSTVKARCPVIRYGTGPLGYVFVHLPPDVRHALRHESLDEAIRRLQEETGRADLQTSEFLPLHEVVADFAERHGLPRRTQWARLCTRGALLAVRALPRDGKGAPVWYVRVPCSVQQTSSSSEVRAWWKRLASSTSEGGSGGGDECARAATAA